MKTFLVTLFCFVSALLPAFSTQTSFEGPHFRVTIPDGWQLLSSNEKDGDSLCAYAWANPAAALNFLVVAGDRSVFNNDVLSGYLASVGAKIEDLEAPSDNKWYGRDVVRSWRMPATKKAPYGTFMAILESGSKRAVISQSRFGPTDNGDLMTIGQSFYLTSSARPSMLIPVANGNRIDRPGYSCVLPPAWKVGDSGENVPLGTESDAYTCAEKGFFLTVQTVNKSSGVSPELLFTQVYHKFKDALKPSSESVVKDWHGTPVSYGQIMAHESKGMAKVTSVILKESPTKMLLIIAEAPLGTEQEIAAASKEFAAISQSFQAK